MRTERATYLDLAGAVRRTERRIDWSMAQFVDAAIDALRLGSAHEAVDAAMYDRGVPDEVRRKVLAGQATHRCREWRKLS